MKVTKRVLEITAKRPQYMTITDLTFLQVDSWFKHCRRDLRMNIMYPIYTWKKISVYCMDLWRWLAADG